MTRGKWTRRWLMLVFLGSTAILCGLTTWLWIRRDHPPIQSLLEARMSLNLARSTANEEPARPLLDSAEQNIADAQLAVAQEYRKLVLFRRYELARYHVDRARKLCGEAVERARDARQSAAADGGRRVSSLRHSLATTRGLVERLNLRGDALVRLSSADAFIKAADARLMEQEAFEARELLDRAQTEIEEASVQLQSRLTCFLERRYEWNSLVRETLAASAQTNEPMVLIDKLNRECHILRRGRVVETFAVEMGNAWMERKLTEGDRATPEGRYQVSALKGQGNSRYYKAALLDYPNQADRTRFVKAKRAGQISRGARIGGLIEIHGEGGRGNNWTAGCVSLANNDMDRLMSFLRAGTPVTIVGVWQEPSWLSSGSLSTGTAVLDRAD
jgi:murein L,D-transpeptidase YafK